MECQDFDARHNSITQQTTGMDTLDFARQYLFDPLGISDIAWLSDLLCCPRS